MNNILQDYLRFAFTPESTNIQNTTDYNPNILHEKAAIGSIHKSRIIRKGFFNSVSYVYEYGDETTGYIPILYAKKSPLNYSIYAYSNQKTPIAQIKSNFLGTEYLLVENKKQTYFLRYEMCMFHNFGPRKMTVFYTGNDDHNVNSLSKRIKEKRWDQVITLVNKLPEYNSVLETYILNFNGRVTEPSIKNYQLIHPMNIDNILLTFGKRDTNIFVVDFTHPLNAVEAFFFGICSLDFKFCYE